MRNSRGGARRRVFSEVSRWFSSPLESEGHREHQFLPSQASSGREVGLLRCQQLGPGACQGLAPHQACQRQLALLITTTNVATAPASPSEPKGAADGFL